MAAQTIIKGRDLMLFNDAGHSYAYATNHTLSINADLTDISSKDHSIWGASEIGKYNWEITSENLYTVTEYDQLFDVMIVGQPITVRFGLKATPADPDMVPADGDASLPYWSSTNTYYEGKVVISSLVTNANNGENATYSVTLTGNGKLKKVTSGQL